MALGTYKQVQFGTLANRLTARLGDPVPSALGPTVGFWSAREVRRHLQEALRTWQAHSLFFSTRASIPTVQGQLFYETGTLIPQLTYSVTDRDLIQDIADHLQEPYTDGTQWTGQQYTLQAVVDAIQQRRDRFKVESGIGMTVREFPYTGGTSGVFEIPDNVIDIRRVMWKDINGIYTTLWRTDQYAMSAGSPAWFQNPGTPIDYSLVLQQPLALQLSPPPNDVGTINIISLNSGGNLNPLVAPTILNLPDDFAWVVKFGVLADLFGEDGIGKDPGRAQYCEERWQDGIKLARIYNTLRFGYLDGVPALMDSLVELDQARPNWMNSAQGAPISLVVTSSIAAVSPVADAGPHSITLDIVPKFPIPQSDEDWVQLGQEYLDVIVDYAEHLCNVKIGAEELKNTFWLYQNFASLAATMNDRLKAQAHNFDVLSDKSRRMEKLVPRRNSDVGRSSLSYDNE